MHLFSNTSTEQPVARPLPSDLVKKVEKEILSEAKDEENNLRKAIKDLTNTEKQENHANRTLVKADNQLGKAEKKERSALKDVYRAEHNHEVAISNVQIAQHELEVSTQGYARTQETLKKKSADVEDAMKEHETNTQLRNSKLNALRGPSAPDEAARVVGEVTHQPIDDKLQSTSQYPPSDVPQ